MFHLGKEDTMLSANSQNSRLLILGKILILVLIVAAVIRSYFMNTQTNFVFPYGFIFILVGGVTLVMISFTGAEIRRALLPSVRASGNDVEIWHSVFFWEAAARGFWMLGGIGSVLNLMVGFEGMKTQESANLGPVIDILIRCLLATFYGTLLAVICLIPRWKLMRKLQNQRLLSSTEQGETLVSIRSRGWSLGTAIGYILFFGVLALIVSNFSVPMLWNMLPLIFHPQALLLVVGGALVLMLFSGEGNSERNLSMSFAAMGFIGSLMGCIQVLSGIASFSRLGTPASIGEVAYGVLFVLSTCFVTLLGLILVGAPLADRAIRIGRSAAPSALSRVSWYGFPLLTLIVVPLTFVAIIRPMPMPKPQLTEVSAPVQEQKTRYEARAPQSEPMDFVHAHIQESNLIYKVNPTYPDQAKREGIQGTVKLTLVINEEGFVYEVKGDPGNNPVLEQAAIPAVKRWRFSPFLIKGVPVALETTATVNFALK
jgi:TonB family protein